MPDKPPNYYEILGVSKNETKQEIKSRYAKLIRDCHPDKIEALRNKYKATNDSVLLKVLEQAIEQAEEKAKLLNEAYRVLSNPDKRKLYDSTLVYIEIKPSKLSVGSIVQGRKVDVSFTIENKGGTVSSINIDWLRKPAWGELTIVPGPKNAFPIKVTVTVSTVGLSPNNYEEQISIEADGEKYYVPINYRVILAPRAVATPKKKKPTFLSLKVVMSLFLITVIGALIITFGENLFGSNVLPFTVTPVIPSLTIIPIELTTLTPSLTMANLGQTSAPTPISTQAYSSTIFSDDFTVNTLDTYQRRGTIIWDANKQAIRTEGVPNNDSAMYTTVTVESSFIATGRVFVPSTGIGRYDSIALALKGDGIEYWGILLYGNSLVEKNNISISRNDRQWGKLYPKILTSGWYTIKLYVDQTAKQIYCKAWAEGDSEPDWQIVANLDSDWVLRAMGFRHAGDGSSWMDDLSITMMSSSQNSSPSDWSLLDYSHQPSPRTGYALAMDESRNKLILFGGTCQGFACDDTWTFDENGWHEINARGPSAREDMAMVYDSQRQRVVLFGGHVWANGYLNDTWEFNGQDWLEVYPTNIPPVRGNYTMAYDSNCGKAVMFGGWQDTQIGENILGDTWEYDEGEWTQVSTINSPLPRAGVRMIYSTDWKKIVLFGGIRYDGQVPIYPNDTWFFDGKEWNKVDAEVSPVGRYDHQLAYDPVRRVMYLFGGYQSGKGSLNDMWEFDGKNWREINPKTLPPRIWNATAVFYPTFKGILLFGGNNPGQNDLIDTMWRYGR